MSKFWNTLPSSEKDEFQGIISKEKPFEMKTFNIEVNEGLNINSKFKTEVSKDLFMFIFENGVSPSGNSYIVDPKTLINRYYTYLTSCSILETDKYLGFAVSVPHNICLKEISNKQIISTGLTTHLTVSLKYRKERLAEILIKRIIYEGYLNKIFTGYHYISIPKTTQNIVVYAYFRPLNIEEAKLSGYEISNQDFNLDTVDKEYKLRSSNLQDFEFIQKIKRNLNIHMNDVTFQNLNIDCEMYTFFHNSEIIGIVIVKPILLYISKTQKICNVARIVYLEMLDKHTQPILTQLIDLLSKKNYVVMSGICFGNLNNEYVKESTGIITSGKLYLDFYNLQLKEYNRNASEINLLYI
jgi:hypothetical protein